MSGIGYFNITVVFGKKGRLSSKMKFDHGSPEEILRLARFTPFNGKRVQIVLCGNLRNIACVLRKTVTETQLASFSSPMACGDEAVPQPAPAGREDLVSLHPFGPERRPTASY